VHRQNMIVNTPPRVIHFTKVNFTRHTYIYVIFIIIAGAGKV